MADDIFDTRFENKDVRLNDNFVGLGDDINLTQKDPSLRRLMIGAGWDVNAFNSDVLDLDLSVFLLNKNGKTRVDEDFVFYNHKETLEGGVKLHGDSRSGAGDGDDEHISIDLQALPFDIVQIAVALTIYKGYEKDQNLGMVRNAYVRLCNADGLQEYCRFELDDVIKDKEQSGMIVASINREGPKWHFKPEADFVAKGLGELARRYDLIINQE